MTNAVTGLISYFLNQNDKDFEEAFNKQGEEILYSFLRLCKSKVNLELENVIEKISPLISKLIDGKIIDSSLMVD